MKNYILYITTCLVLLSGCEDVLDKEDPSAVSPSIWTSEESATLFLNALYEKSVPLAAFGANSNNSDEAPAGSDNDPLYGRLTIKSVTDYSLGNFTEIRNINIAIEEIEKSPLSQEVKTKLSSQAYFLRAWEYWELVKLYGGVPLILEPLNPYEDNMDIPRSKTSECIDQIVADLDLAIAGLPKSWSDSERGRVTRGAAAALKGRVLLYWASPQFNPSNSADRWQRAYTANKEAKEMLLQDGKGLYNKFEDIFLVENNKEVVFARLYDRAADKTHGWENSARPRLVGGDGGTSSNPTIHLVEAFPMKNGLSIKDAGSGYDAVYFWKNRDPRFYATIVYNGAVYDFPDQAPAGRRQWQYYYRDGSSLKSVETSNPTKTGFYTRKAINKNIPKPNVKLTDTDWVEIRFAEVLMNLAECANEVDLITETYDELTAIRSRAGITAGTNGKYGLKENMTKEEMRDAIMLERQIEFAFENKRYWDLRRRNLFAEKLNGTRRYGIRTILKSTWKHSDFLNMRDTIKLDTRFSVYFDVEQWLKDDKEPINYPQPQYNFFAIPQNMLDRSPAVKQTMLWENGTFDPLE